MLAKGAITIEEKMNLRSLFVLIHLVLFACLFIQQIQLSAKQDTYYVI